MKSQSKKILVIDDEKDIRNAIRVILTREGYGVFEDTGLQAVEIAERERPNLILLDMFLKGVTVEEIFENLKRSAVQKIPIVIVSGHADATELVQKYGFCGVLKKPFGIQELLNVVKQYAQ